MSTADPIAGARAPNWLERFTLGMCGAATLALLAVLLHHGGSGVDFTDEGYYLNWIAHPELYANSHTQFGFVFHPIYKLTGESVGALRQLNVLLTFGSGWLLFASLLIPPAGLRRAGLVPVISLSFVLAASSLLCFVYWLPTPSYNTLALQGLMLGSAGIALTRFDSARIRWIGCSVLGVASWLTFMAKPTTAFVAGVLWLLCIVATGRMAWRQFAVTGIIALGLLVLSALAIDGSVAGFVHRLANASADMEQLQGGYTLKEIFRWDPLVLGDLEKCLIWGGAGFIFVGGFLCSMDHRSTRLLGTSLMALAMIILLIALFASYTGQAAPLDLFGVKLTTGLIYSPEMHWVNSFPSASVVTLAWPAGGLLLVLGRLYWHRPRIGEIVTALGLFCLPYAYVFGTNSGYWSAMGGAAVFWCAAGTLPLWTAASGAPAWHHGLSLAVATFTGAVLILVLATELPYRQANPLRANQATIVTPSGGILRVSPDVARYVSVLQATLEENGFRPGDPWIDLSGHYPTAAYLVGARHVGLAWLPGGYPGSHRFVQISLDRVPLDELKRAWILSEPNGIRKLSASLLHRYGLDLERDYIEVSTIETPIADYSKPFTQHLYRPRLPAPPVSN